MEIRDIKLLFETFKEKDLYNRYITNNHIEPLLKNFSNDLEVEIIGFSVKEKSIYGLKTGSGDKRILMWSQMHGNESTTTKALFDLLNTLLGTQEEPKHILKNCTLYLIPILNPDGAEVYTRINANNIDLNRDAQLLTQPESVVLRNIFKRFKPHYCFNLHGQRTIFSAGNSNFPATVSFLAPAQDATRAITTNRKVAMEIIVEMNEALQKIIPNQVGMYDDAFNLNCVGDAFQSKNVPTILFEAGHFFNDYEREETRAFIYISLLTAINYISDNNVTGENYQNYFEIPENDKCFLDIIIRNAKLSQNDSAELIDIGILYQEKLIGGRVSFIPKIEKIGSLVNFYGHREIDAKGSLIKGAEGKSIEVDYENVCVIINNEEITLLLK